MAKPFNELRERLLRAGVAPRHVRRYLRELADHLADLRAAEEVAGRSREDAESAALARLGGMDELANKMIEQRKLQSWCVRAPWAMLGLVPLSVLAAAWILALLILWSGWRIFLPGAETPFVPVDGFAIVYFGIGRWMYFGAPVLIGWGIGVIAARQRMKAVWPLLGSVLIACVACAAQVHTSRPAVPGGAGNIGLDFVFDTSVAGISSSLIHALAILLLAALPYLVWRLRKARALAG